jgi:hypothetical protein
MVNNHKHRTVEECLNIVIDNEIQRKDAKSQSRKDSLNVVKLSNFVDKDDTDEADFRR